MKIRTQRVLKVISLASVCITSLVAPKASAQKRRESDLLGFAAVSYCDLIRSPQDYDGKQVAVRATYRYGFEWQELFCMMCRNEAKVWLEFDRDMASSVKFHHAPRYQGMINATFYGIFRGRKGAYGDGGYQYQFDLNFVKNDKVVSRDGRIPELLPADVQKRLCQQ